MATARSMHNIVEVEARTGTPSCTGVKQALSEMYSLIAFNLLSCSTSPSPSLVKNFFKYTNESADIQQLSLASLDC